MTFKIILLLSFCTCFLSATSSRGEVILLSQNRTVYCSAYVADEQWNEFEADSTRAPDFDLFNPDVSATIYNDLAFASGSAHQNSTIHPTLFRAVGGCAANAGGYDEWAYGDAQARTFFQCEFEINAPTQWVLTGSLEAFDYVAVANLDFTGPDLDLHLGAGFNNILDLDESGELAPGIYTFTVWAHSSAIGDAYGHGSSYGGFDLELAFTSTSATPASDHDALTLRLSPNPFSHGTEIAFSAPSRRTSNLEIFDLRGRLVRSLVTGSRESGRLSWDGKNSRGLAVATGTYFVVLKSGNEIRREKAILVR